MKIRGKTVVWTGIVVILLAIIGMSLALPHWQSKMIPLIISGICVILSAVVLRGEFAAAKRERTAPSEAKKDGAGEESEFGGSWRGYLRGIAWTGGFLLAIYLLGFLISMPLFVILLMRRLGSSWRTTIICAVLTPAVIYGLFEVLLGITLYRGLLIELLGYGG